MSVDPSSEARLLGRLALRGILPRSAVEALFDQARARAESGAPVSLRELAVEQGLLSDERWERLAATDGDDVPELPGHRYIRKLGEGGTANVYEVERGGGQRFAVKILKPEPASDVRIVKGFLAEAKLLAQLDHPGVVKGHKAGRLSGHYLSFMDVVEGRTLQEAIAEGGVFSEEEALRVILNTARSLEYLRSKGIVHRDIKPGNIMVTPDQQVRVIDLGFALASDGTGSEETTIGTAGYLSPEQARGQRDLDVRSDIYALGATLYQLVLGELPHTGDDTELVQKAVLEGLSAEATKGGRISASMHYIIEKMMAKDRSIRFQDPAELMADIEAQIEGKKDIDALSGDDPEDDEDAAAARRRKLNRMRRRRHRR